MVVKTQHRLLTNTALPYITSLSLIDSKPRFVAGSNVKTSMAGYLERRPGFAAYTTDDYGTDHTIKRFFTWQKWDNTFFVMLNVIDDDGISALYKQEVGVDSAFVPIYAAVSDEPWDFAVSNNWLFMGNGTEMMKWDGIGTIRAWGIAPPPDVLDTALTSTGLSPTIGYKYVIAFYDPDTGGTSSPSPIMPLFVKPVNQKVTISGNVSGGVGASMVRMYRTTDGGSVYFELPASPITRLVWNASGYEDGTADIDLTSTIAPLQHQNDPPPPAFGPVWFAGRLWIFKGDRVYFSGWEEIPLGTSDMPEECFPIDNYYPFGQTVKGLGVAGDPATGGVLMVFCDGGIHKVSGDSLDTFKRGTLTRKGKGLRQRATIFTYNRTAGWLDSSNTIHYTDGSTIQELSLDIRPDLVGIDHSLAAATAHDDGINHWIMLMDGGRGRIHVFDTDLEQWMPPWTLTDMEAIFSGETAPGDWRVFLGRLAKPLALTPTTYLDEDAEYTASAVTNLVDIVSDKPDTLGQVFHIGVERNAVRNSAVRVLTDDDPATGDYVNLAEIPGNPVDPRARTNGKDLIEKLYKTEAGPIARRASVALEWAAGDTNFKLYSLDIAYKETH